MKIADPPELWLDWCTVAGTARMAKDDHLPAAHVEGHDLRKLTV